VILNTLELGVLTACVGVGLDALLSYVTCRRLVVGHPCSSTAHSGSCLSRISPRRCPSATRSDATFKAVPADLDDAGRILGGGRLRVLRDVTPALARSGVIAAWCSIFIGVIGELSASIILFTPATKVMSVVIFDLKEEGQSGRSPCSAW